MESITKVFDENGELKVRFKSDRTEQIINWLKLNNTSLDHAMKYAKDVEDRVFGKSLEFPCSVITNPGN